VPSRRIVSIIARRHTPADIIADASRISGVSLFRVSEFNPESPVTIELDRCGLIDVRYGPIATKFRIAAK